MPKVAEQDQGLRRSPLTEVAAANGDCRFRAYSFDVSVGARIGIVNLASKT
jgi:hypothetical protein